MNSYKINRDARKWYCRQQEEERKKIKNWNNKPKQYKKKLKKQLNNIVNLNNKHMLNISKTICMISIKIRNKRKMLTSQKLKRWVNGKESKNKIY